MPVPWQSSFKMTRRVISSVLLVFSLLQDQIQVEGKVPSSQVAPKINDVSEANPGEGLASSYSTIPHGPAGNKQQHNGEASNIVNDYAAAGNSGQGRNSGVSNSPFQLADSGNTVASYASYQHPQTPYFYGSPPYYAKKHGKNYEGFQISRQTFPTGTGATGAGGGGDFGGDGDLLGGLSGLAGLLGLKGLKGLKLLGAPLLPFLLLPLLLPVLPILLLGALLPLLLFLIFVPLPVITTGRAQDEGSSSSSFSDGVPLRMLHLSSALSKFASDVLNSEDCVERISCEISKMSKSYKLTRFLNKMAGQLPKGSLISKRITKGMAQDDFSSIVQEKPPGGANKVAKRDAKECEVFTCKSNAAVNLFQNLIISSHEN